MREWAVGPALATSDRRDHQDVRAIAESGLLSLQCADVDAIRVHVDVTTQSAGLITDSTLEHRVNTSDDVEYLSDSCLFAVDRDAKFTTSPHEVRERGRQA